MALLRGCSSAAGWGLVLLACGEAPAPPGPLLGSSGAGSASIDGDILPNQPGAGGAAPEPSSGSDAGVPAAADSGAPPAAPPVDGPSGSDPGGNLYFACTEFRLLGCDYIYITAVDPERELCVQITLDSCDVYGDGRFQVDMPLSWRFASASVLTNADECEPGEFYAASESIIAARGTIQWNDDTRQPTELVLDVSLEPSRAGAGLSETLALATEELVGPLPECDS